MSNGTRKMLALWSVPIRLIGVPGLARLVVLTVGLGAMTALTVPDAERKFGIWLVVGLWMCLACFVVEFGVKLASAARAGDARRYLLSVSGTVDLLSIIPVPIALIDGIPPATAWLFASLWVLKLAQNSPGFAQLGRVFILEAKPLASVLGLFFITLFLSSAAVHVLERENQTEAFGTLPDSLWWAVVTLTTTGYGDAVPQSYLGRLIGSFVMICGIATFGLWTGILANGFAAESRRRNFVQTWDLVTRVPFFQSLDPAAIAEITQHLRRLEVPAETIIIRRGKHGDCMYFIAEGEVQVEVMPKPVRLGAGAFFGELALLGDSVRSANVFTTKGSSLLILELAEFRTLTARHPDLARAIDAEGQRRRRENQRRREAQLEESASPSA